MNSVPSSMNIQPITWAPWGLNGQMSCHYFPGAFQEMADQRSEGRTGCCRRSSAFELQSRTASGVSLLALPTVGAEAAKSRAQASLPVTTTGPAKMAALWPAASSHTHTQHGRRRHVPVLLGVRFVTGGQAGNEGCEDEFSARVGLQSFDVYSLSLNRRKLWGQSPHVSCLPCFQPGAGAWHLVGAQ